MSDEQVFLNGPPRMGNHALWKTCELLGIDSNGVNHLPWIKMPKGGPKRLFIKRDPRNALLSWMRHNGLLMTQTTAISRMRKYLETLQHFERWLHDQGTLVVSFERLLADDQQMREIAAHCGVEYVDDAWQNLPNHTRTWTGNLSDYRAIWSEKVDRAWRERDGSAVLVRWGYDG